MEILKDFFFVRGEHLKSLTLTLIRLLNRSIGGGEVIHLKSKINKIPEDINNERIKEAAAAEEGKKCSEYVQLSLLIDLHSDNTLKQLKS